MSIETATDTVNLYQTELKEKQRSFEELTVELLEIGERHVPWHQGMFAAVAHNVLFVQIN